MFMKLVKKDIILNAHPPRVALIADVARYAMYSPAALDIICTVAEKLATSLPIVMGLMCSTPRPTTELFFK